MKNNERKNIDESIDEITMPEELKSRIRNLKISRNIWMLCTYIMALASGINTGNLVLKPTISRAFLVAGSTLSTISYGMVVHLHDTKLNKLNNEYKKLVKY